MFLDEQTALLRVLQRGWGAILSPGGRSYRLKMFLIPPLRERGQDNPLLHSDSWFISSSRQTD